MVKTHGSTNNYVHKVKGNFSNQVKDSIAIEEPLEIIICYFDNNNWLEQTLAITMRTIGDDESLVVGMLFSEGVISTKNDIDKIECFSDNKSKYNSNNTIKITLSIGVKLDLKKLERHFIVSSSCGVCGKGSINAIKIAYEPKINKNYPVIKADLITKLPKFLQNNQYQFAKTGGVHASALFDNKGKMLHLAEDVGRHNALDKLIGYANISNILIADKQLIMCSGRLSFDIIQKTVMAGIGIVAGIGAPTSLAVDLAKNFDITIIGFIKQDSYNVYNGLWRISGLKSK